MARTLRRKDYIEQHRRSGWISGRKVNGFYTEYEYVGPGLYEYRPCTKQERFKKFKEAHLDAGTYRAHMNVWARREEMNVDRQKVRQEIHRFMKGVVEDVIVSEQKKCPFWHW